jgi:transposase
MPEAVSRITSERVDDLPVIMHWLLQMNLPALIDQHLPRPHGNRQGLSYGQLSVLLLAYIVSQGDHRLCAVEPWVRQHHKTLEWTTGWQIGEKDASDDRLADLIEVIGTHSESRERIESCLGQQLIRAYELPTTVARCDTSSFSVYHHLEEDEQDSSLLRYGHSKDRRPDLRQYRQLLGTLDPAGMPLVSSTLAGNGVDDPLYVPTWHKLASVIGHQEFVYIADCKAASQSNRAQIDAAGGTYCFPLPETGHNATVLKTWLLHPASQLQEIRLPGQSVEESAIGVGFEMELGQLWQDPDTQQHYRWSERYLVVRSHALQQRQLQGLHQRLHRAEQAIAKLAARPSRDCCELINQVQTTLKRHRVSDFFTFEVQRQMITRYRGRGRPSAKDTTRVIHQEQFTVQFQRQEQAINQAEVLAGWRIYVTNAPIKRLPLPTAVAYYREQWQLERGFHRFKRGNLPALPIYLQSQQRIIGLMFLLTIALRLFTLMEFVVFRNLQGQPQGLRGLYQGNPKRATRRPTAERLLAAFCDITLYHYRDGTFDITPLNDLHKQILSLMAVPESVYDLTKISTRLTN